jgi:hypothetical protein
MAVKRKTTRRKKATTTTRRRRPAARATAAPRRRVKRRKSMLGAPTQAAIKSTLIDITKAAAGVLIYNFVMNQKVLDNQSDTNKGLIGLGLAVITATMAKQPLIGAGMGAGAALKLAQGLGAGALIGLNDMGNDQFLLPISENAVMSAIPYGLSETVDYAGLNDGQNVYASNYSNQMQRSFF